MLTQCDETHSFEDSTKELGDDELIDRLRRLLAGDRAVTAKLLVHLGEVDARGLYRQHGHSSMFDYCVHALHMSEAEAFTRIRAARAGRAFPVVFSMVHRGELHLSAVKLLAPVLTQANHERLLAEARLKSKREIELILARIFSKADVPSVIRKLPGKPAAPPEVVMSVPLPSLVPGSSSQLIGSIPIPQPRRQSNHQLRPPSEFRSAGPTSTVGPLSPGRYKVQFTASQRLQDKLRQAQDLLRHQVPDGDLATVLERALDQLIAERMKQRFAAGREARRSSGSKAGSRHIPNAVRRQVLARDGAQCTYVSAEGKRCQERGLLEFHHEQPFGRGGPPTTENIRVLCAAHNRLRAEQDYGRDLIVLRIAEARVAREALQLVLGPPEQGASADDIV